MGQYLGALFAFSFFLFGVSSFDYATGPAVWTSPDDQFVRFSKNYGRREQILRTRVGHCFGAIYT